MTSDRALEMFPVWSPDGQSIAFGEAKGSPPTLARRLLAGGPTELLATSGHQRPGSFSRDGIRISDNRGSRPRWSRSGDALFFMEDPPKVVMAKRGGSGPWKDATLTTLFDLPALRAVDAITAFDVSPSGDAFLIGETRAGDGDGDLHVILHAH